MGKMAILEEGPIVMEPIELKGGTLNRKFFHKETIFFRRRAIKILTPPYPGQRYQLWFDSPALKRPEGSVVMGLCGDDRFPSTQQFTQD